MAISWRENEISVVQCSYPMLLWCSVTCSLLIYVFITGNFYHRYRQVEQVQVIKAEWEVNQQEGEKNSNATWFGKWSWLYCIQPGCRGQRREGWRQSEDVKNLLFSRRQVNWFEQYWTGTFFSWKKIHLFPRKEASLCVRERGNKFATLSLWSCRHW